MSIANELPTGFRRSAIIAVVALGLVSPAAAASDAAPTIEITQVPPVGGGSHSWGTLAGKTTAAAPDQHRVVIYARTDQWYVQPWIAQPFTTLRPDGGYQTGTHLGYEYGALLVVPSFEPLPRLADLPAVGHGVLAVSRVAGR